MQRTVYLYWTGHEYKLINILRELINLHSNNGKGYTVILITPNNVTQYIKQLPSYFFDLIPAHQADYVRVNVICEYGGIWLDSDTIVLDKLDHLFDLIENSDGFLIREHNGKLINSVFGSKSNTKLMLEWKQYIFDTLEQKKLTIGWSDIGSVYLNDFSKYVSCYNVFENKIYNPVFWENVVNEFLIYPYDNYQNIDKNQQLIILYNSVYKYAEKFSLDEIFGYKFPISHFLRKSKYNYITSNINKNICVDTKSDAIVNITKPLIYLKISETGGSSMCDALNSAFSRVLLCVYSSEIPANIDKIINMDVIILANPETIKSFKKMHFQVYKNAPKVIIFRNPLKRLLSCYNYMKNKKPDKFNAPLEELLKNTKFDQPTNDDKLTLNSNHIHFSLLQLDSIDLDIGILDNPTYMVIDFENINIEIPNLFNKFGAKSMILSHLNSSLYSKNTLTSNEEILAINIFKRDIEFYDRIHYKQIINSVQFIKNLTVLNNSIITALHKTNKLPAIIGNLFYDHEQLNFNEHPLLKECEDKRIRFSNLAKISTSMLEIGFNGGHSALLALSSNKKLVVHSNDIARFYELCPNLHPEIYVIEAFNTLVNIFPNRLVPIIGDCLVEIPKYIMENPHIKFDLVHIDGAKETYRQDFYNILSALLPNCIIIFDDTQQENINALVYELISSNLVTPLEKYPEMEKSIKYRNQVVRFNIDNYRAKLFADIYQLGKWNNNLKSIPLSGPGSSIDNTVEIRKLLDEFVVNYNIRSINDLGCGDLTWINTTNLFNNDNIQYIGIDIVESVILKNMQLFPKKIFKHSDVVQTNIDSCDLIILRDIIFHLSISDIILIFKNIKNKFKYICITCSNNSINIDNNHCNKSHFSDRNLRIHPFNIVKLPLFEIKEQQFNRCVYIYTHEQFY